MRFDEPDVREAYRQGARDCYESLMTSLKPRDIEKLEAWLSQLDGWEDGEPPLTPSGLST